MTEATLRQATRHDAGRLNHALAQLSQTLGDTHHASDAQIAAAGWGPHPAFRAILAEQGNTVVGAALYSPSFSTARGGAVVYVSDLWVDTDTRGSGLGPRLLAAVVRDAQATWGAQKMKLNVYHATPRARSFYERLGFAPASGQTEMHLDATGCAALKETR